MNEAVSRYDGVVNKAQGDGVMALFGAPQPHEDHAVRGCLAALAMQEEVKNGKRPLEVVVKRNYKVFFKLEMVVIF